MEREREERGNSGERQGRTNGEESRRTRGEEDGWDVVRETALIPSLAWECEQAKRRTKKIGLVNRLVCFAKAFRANVGK